jgi:hypothetical protein
MKNFILVAIVLISLLSINSCSEKFKVGAPYKEVMIVHGILDENDTAHYVKITKGFFDEENNNLLATKNIDSIYYDSLYVVISKVNKNGAVLQNYTLQKVDLKNEGIVKDTGIFAASPAFAYKLKQTLDPSFNYKINVTNPKTGKVVYSTTPILNTKQFEAQDLFGTFLDLSDTSLNKTFVFTPCENAAIVEIYLRFHYFEEWIVNGNTVGELKFADLPILTRKPVIGTGLMSHTFVNKNKYGLIGSGIGPAALGVKRFVDTPDVVFYVGGVELKKYIDITSIQGGITADQIKPIYTNMQGGDVYGLFSTRGKKAYYELPFTKATVDDLIGNPLAKSLNIVGRSPI